jgi:hypothetical protein
VDGCNEVPDPIADIDITLVSLEPTRIPIPSFVITNNGPMSIESIAGDGEVVGIGIPGVC